MGLLCSESVHGLACLVLHMRWFYRCVHIFVALSSRWLEERQRGELSRGVEHTVIGVRLETDEERVMHVTVSYIYSLEDILTCTYTIII